MPWFKVDDKFHDHPKVRRLGKDKLAAVGLWTTCGSWAGDRVTDGFVPTSVVRWHDAKERLAKKLVDVGLWTKSERDGEPGYQFHQWADYQPTREDIEVTREEWRRKKAAQRKPKRPMSPGDTPEDNNVDSTEESTKESNEIPGSRSRTRSPIGGHLGEGTSPPARADEQPPPPRCPKHEQKPADGPCGKCADARRAREAWEDADAARREHIARDIEAAVADPRQRCGHGTDGGLFEHPVTGKSATCALCRKESTRDAS